MRPPILFLTIAFGAGLYAGLDLFVVRGAWYAVVPVLGTALLVARRAPLGTALGVMGVAGLVWGMAAGREREATCAGSWSRERGAGSSKSVTVGLEDPAPASGGIVDAQVLAGTCGGSVRLRWPEGTAARGGTTWVVAGGWSGAADRGVLVVRRARPIDPVPRGRGALRDALAAKSTELFGARAPIVNALVFAPNARLDSDIRERYVRSGLAHLLSISGLHVGFIAAWLALILGKLPLAAPARFGATAVLLLGYLWLLGFPAPAVRAGAMLALAEVARLRERVVAPRGVVALAALGVLLQDAWALESVGAWLSVAGVGAVVWAGRAFARAPRLARLAAPALAATLVTAPISALAFGTVAPIGVLANLIAIPLAGVAVPGLVLALMLSWLGSGLAHLIAAGAGLGLALLDLVARGAALVPGGHAGMVAGWAAALAWATVAVAAWWLWNSPRRPWLIAARVAFVTTVLVATTFRDVVSLDDCRCLTVHFLDVGQGDAAALRTPNGRWIVIDGGPRTPERDAGRRVVVPFLRGQGVGRVTVFRTDRSGTITFSTDGQGERVRSHHD